MNQAVIITDPKAIESFAMFCAIQAMELHVKSQGRLMLTRTATPANIARRFNLTDPRTKRAPRTAQKCLELLKAARTKQLETEAAHKVAIATLTDHGTNN